MKSLIATIILCLTLLTACKPEDRVIWSPDGKRAAVLASDGLRVSDDTGTISAPLLVDVQICRWLPDSIHTLVVSSKTTTSWEEIKNLYSKGERLKILHIAQSIWRAGSATKLTSLDQALVPDALIYLRYKYGVKALQTRLADKRTNDYSIIVEILKILDLANKNPLSGAVLWRTTKTIDDVRVSPSGNLAAVSVRDGLAYKIIVIPLKVGQPKIAVETLADFPDWSADGKSLFYISYPKVDENVHLSQLWESKHPWVATLNRREIADANGMILPKFAPAKELAEVLAADSSRVRCLPDGSVVFHAKQCSFPSLKKTDPQVSLFKLRPDGQSLEPILASKGLPGDMMNAFEPNQDGTKISVPGEHGEITVLDMASGTVTTLEKGGDGDLKFIPQWRTNEELCYPARNRENVANGHHADVVLQSLSEPSRRINLSKNWPSTSIEFLNDDEKPADTLKTKATSTKSKRKIMSGAYHRIQTPAGK